MLVPGKYSHVPGVSSRTCVLGGHHSTLYSEGNLGVGVSLGKSHSVLLDLDFG